MINRDYPRTIVNATYPGCLFFAPLRQLLTLKAQKCGRGPSSRARTVETDVDGVQEGLPSLGLRRSLRYELHLHRCIDAVLKLDGHRVGSD